MGSGASMTGGAEVEGVGVGGTELEMDPRGVRDLRDGNRLGHKATAFKRVGINVGGSTTGGAEVDGVSIGAIDREWDLDP